MDPLTIMALGSTALTAISKLGGGFTGSHIDLLQKGVADQNTQLLMTRAGLEAKGADLAYAGGALDQNRVQINLNRTIGTANAHFAAANVDPTYGSPLVAQGFSASQGRADEDLIAARARMQAAGALMTSAGTVSAAASSNNQAAGLGMKSSQDIMSGYFGAATTMLSGFSSAFKGSGGGSLGAGGMGLPAGNATGGRY
jgi:hypothetical protein